MVHNYDLIRWLAINASKYLIKINFYNIAIQGINADFVHLTDNNFITPADKSNQSTIITLISHIRVYDKKTKLTFKRKKSQFILQNKWFFANVFYQLYKKDFTKIWSDEWKRRPAFSQCRSLAEWLNHYAPCPKSHRKRAYDVPRGKLQPRSYSRESTSPSRVPSH